jgi:hypothetical protein
MMPHFLPALAFSTSSPRIFFISAWSYFSMVNTLL